MKDLNLNQDFRTLSEAINGLAKLGYTHDFNRTEEFILSERMPNSLSPGDFQIDHFYRFEGDSDPEYQSILYAISSKKFGVKGILVNGYGISFNEASFKLVEKLKTHREQRNIEEKSIDATPLRPEGERLLNASLVEMDLFEYIRQIKAEATWAERDRNSFTLYKSDALRILLIGLHENAELKPHKSNGVISIQVLQGKLEFSTDEQNKHLERGQMIALQENISHGVKALTESFFLLTLAMNHKEA